MTASRAPPLEIDWLLSFSGLTQFEQLCPFFLNAVGAKPHSGNFEQNWVDKSLTREDLGGRCVSPNPAKDSKHISVVIGLAASS